MPTIQPQFDFDRIDRRTKQVTPALIAAVCDRIVEHIQPEQIILFGSQATGTVREDSDLDLLIIIRDDHRLAPLLRRDRFGEILQMFRYSSFALDAIVLTSGEIKNLIDINEGEWDMILEIMETGRRIYGSTEERKVERARPRTHERMVSQS